MGKTHPATMGAVKGIGHILLDSGMFTEALSKFELALLERERALGFNDVLTANVRVDIVDLFSAWEYCGGSGLPEALSGYLKRISHTSHVAVIMHHLRLANWYEGKEFFGGLEDIPRIGNISFWLELLAANNESASLTSKEWED
jgi:hypothetical protein